MRGTVEFLASNYEWKASVWTHDGLLEGFLTARLQSPPPFRVYAYRERGRRVIIWPESRMGEEAL